MAPQAKFWIRYPIFELITKSVLETQSQFLSTLSDFGLIKKIMKSRYPIACVLCIVTKCFALLVTVIVEHKAKYCKSGPKFFK